MKKNVFEMVVAMVNGQPVADMDTLRNEINAEWNKMTEKKQANRDLYDAAHDILMNALTDKEQTAKELFESNEWPDGFKQGKLNYALRAMWADEINKIDNGKNANTYTRK